MKLYFITTNNVQPKNAKSRAAVEFCMRYHHTLASGRISYDAIVAEIKLFCKELNTKFTRARAIMVNNTCSGKQMNGYEWITIRFDGEVHNHIVQLRFTKVEKLFQFSELVPVTNSSQLELK